MDGNTPLSSEELARDEWREGETFVSETEAAGHTVPESERDPADTENGAGARNVTPPPIIPPD